MRIDVTMTEETFRRFTMFDLFRRRKVCRAPAIWAAILCGSAAICFGEDFAAGDGDAVDGAFLSGADSRAVEAAVFS